jgi:sporulation protein YlmC with PRC-barrel domain
MKSILISGAAVAALAVLPLSAVHAYQGAGVPLTTEPVPPSPDLSGAGAVALVPDYGPASALVGASVHDQNDDYVGKVSYVILDRQSRRIVGVVIGVQMFLYSKDVAVAANDVARLNGRLVVDITKRDLQREVAYRP